MKNKNLLILLLAVPVLAGTTLISCSSMGERSAMGETGSSPVEPDNNVYVITASQFKASGMKTGALEKRKFKRSVKSNGMIDVPPENKASVSAYFGGYVREITLLPGDKVKKGQVLFTLENPEYIEIQRDFLEADSRLAYLRSDYERQKSLASEGVSSEKKYLKAEAEYRATKVRVASLRKKLQLMNIDPSGLNENEIRSRIPVLSPISGYVSEIHLSKGLYLDPSDVAMNIINTDHLHLELSVFEQNLGQIRKGQEIRFRVQNNPSVVYLARVHLVNPGIDRNERTFKIHAHPEEGSDPAFLVPGMYVESEIFIRSHEGPALPHEAVVENDGRKYVLLLRDSTESEMLFEKREVKTGASSGNYYEILNAGDFEADARFLLTGAFRMISE